MNPARHFALCFFGPIITGALYCAVIGLMWDWLDQHRVSPIITMMGGCVVVACATRWFLRHMVTVKCPYCGGKSYEIQGRGNRFMCVNCGKDH